MSYQLINVIDATQNIACPYCHQAVLDCEQEQYVQPCEHTLFMAMDLGFEFIADRFEEVQTFSLKTRTIHCGYTGIEQQVHWSGNDEEQPYAWREFRESEEEF